MTDHWYRNVKPHEDEYSAGVYAIAHDATGFCYIGAAVRFNRRWDRHIRDLDYGYHSCAPLQKIWDIEGPSALTFNIVEFYHPGPGNWVNITDILPLERRWIDHFRRLGCCYNSPEKPSRIRSPLPSRSPWR